MLLITQELEKLVTKGGFAPWSACSSEWLDFLAHQRYGVIESQFCLFLDRVQRLSVSLFYKNTPAPGLDIILSGHSPGKWQEDARTAITGGVSILEEPRCYHQHFQPQLHHGGLGDDSARQPRKHYGADGYFVAAAAAAKNIQFPNQ